MTPATRRELLALVKEDYRRHRRELWTPGFQALAVHRFGGWADAQSGLAGRAARKLYGALFLFVRNVYGIEIPRTASIGRRVEIGHQHGIVFHKNVVIGDDCVIRHGATIGVGVYGKREEAAVLEPGVIVGPGAVIIGGVRIGAGARIGPNALVTTDVPAGATVFEKPTRIMRLTRPEPADDPA